MSDQAEWWQVIIAGVVAFFSGGGTVFTLGYRPLKKRLDDHDAMLKDHNQQIADNAALLRAIKGNLDLIITQLLQPHRKPEE